MYPYSVTVRLKKYMLGLWYIAAKLNDNTVDQPLIQVIVHYIFMYEGQNSGQY